MGDEQCKAKRQTDGSMFCERCEFLWDHDDPEPPVCLTGFQIKQRDSKRLGRRYLNFIKEELET